MWPDEANLAHPPGYKRARTYPATLMTLDDSLTVRHTPRGSDIEAPEPKQPTGVLPATQSFV